MTQDEKQAWAREIGWRLKCSRLWAGLPLQAAADALGVHRQTLASYEAAVWHLPVVTFALACQLYGVSPSKVLRGPGDRWEGEPAERPAGG